MKNGERNIKKIAIASLSAITVIGLGTVCQNFGSNSPITPKKYTVMLYMVGSDLEETSDSETYGAASTDLMEIYQTIKEYHLNEKVNVVAEIGGAEQWSIPELKDVTNAIISVSEDGIQIIQEQADVNLGESESLETFVNYAYDNYPAENYMLIFWNHGDGPAQGFGDDVLHNDDSLLLDEIDEGLGNAELEKFDLIGFDACCMGNVETLNAVSSYCDYMVASPSSEDIAGWNYSWLSILNGNDISVENKFEKIGTAIVDSYADYFETQGNYNQQIVTLACYDTKVYKESVYPVLCELNENYLADADKDYMASLNRERSGLQGYFSGKMFSDYLDLVDLYQFYDCVLNQNNPESDVITEELNNLAVALNQMICSTNLKKEDGFCGIALFLPNKSDLSFAVEIRNYLNCGYDDTYLDFVRRYSLFMDSELENDFKIIDVMLDKNSMDMTFTLSEDMVSDISQIYAVTGIPTDNEDQIYLVATDSDVSIYGENAVAHLDKEYFSINGEILCSIEILNREDMTQYQCPVIYNDQLCIMIVEVNSGITDPIIKSLTPFADDRQSEKVQYTLKAGDKINAVYPLVDIGLQDTEISLMQTLEDGRYYKGDDVWLDEFNCELEWTELEFSACEFHIEIVDSYMNVHWK
jgi:hypothetical protein